MVALDAPVRTMVHNLDKVLMTGMPVMVVFESPACEECQKMEGSLKELAKEYAGKSLIVRVDDAHTGEINRQFSIQQIPTIVLWREGQEIGRLEGAMAQGVLKDNLEYLIGNRPRPKSAETPAGQSKARGTQPREGKKTSADSGAPVVVTDATFEEVILRSPIPVLVDFWAPWCGPCRMVAPAVKELGQEFAGQLRVAKVNTDENSYQASQLGIRGIPTLILFKNGHEVARVVGAAPKSTLKAKVEQALRK